MSVKILLHFGIDNGDIFSKGINYSVRDRLLLPKLDITMYIQYFPFDIFFVTIQKLPKSIISFL